MIAACNPPIVAYTAADIRQAAATADVYPGKERVMSVKDRRKRLIGMLEAKKRLSLEEAMRTFSVSAATARRDFAYLQERGLAFRERRHIRRLDVNAGSETPLEIRETQFEREKNAIMREASRLLRPNDVVFVDVGSTLLHLVEYMPTFSLRVITTFMEMAMALARRQNRMHSLEICVVGGALYPQSYYTYGPASIKSIEVFHANWAFISPDSLDEDSFQEVNEFIAENQKAMIRCSDRIVLAASHNKFAHKSMVRVEKLDERFTVVTDHWEDNEPILRRMEKNGVKVVRAKVY